MSEEDIDHLNMMRETKKWQSPAHKQPGGDGEEDEELNDNQANPVSLELENFSQSGF